jgi:anti-sigma B factor antagonist
MADTAGVSGDVLKLSSRQEGQARVLSASGQLTEKECAAFMAALVQELSAPSERLVLDLGGLMYMSSAGLGTLVAIHKRFADANRRLIMAGANSRVRKLLALTSLDRLIDSAPGVEEALKLP